MTQHCGLNYVPFLGSYIEAPDGMVFENEAFGDWISPVFVAVMRLRKVSLMRQ